MSKVSLEESDENENQLDVERRRSARAELTIRIDYATVDELFSEFTSDINEGGLFIETDKPKEPGTEVTMEFRLPGKTESVKTLGRVVRNTSGDAQSPAGMGIEFDELTDQDRAMINDMIRSLRADGPVG